MPKDIPLMVDFETRGIPDFMGGYLPGHPMHIQQFGRGVRPSCRSFLSNALASYELPESFFAETVTVPPMVRNVEAAPEPESASVVMLRSLVADRRRIKANAESSRKSRLSQAEDAEKRAADLRDRAKHDDATVLQADEEIFAILADIEKLGGKPE